MAVLALGLENGRDVLGEGHRLAATDVGRAEPSGHSQKHGGCKLFSRCRHLKVCSLAEISRPLCWSSYPNTLWQAIMSHLMQRNKGWRSLVVGFEKHSFISTQQH
jgi:hypothetical protein